VCACSTDDSRNGRRTTDSRSAWILETLPYPGVCSAAIANTRAAATGSKPKVTALHQIALASGWVFRGRRALARHVRFSKPGTVGARPATTRGGLRQDVARARRRDPRARAPTLAGRRVSVLRWSTIV